MKEEELKKEIEKIKEKFMKNKTRSRFRQFQLLQNKQAQLKSYQQAKSEVSSGKFAVKLVEQGKDIGKSEAIKEFEKMIERNPNFFINDDAQILFKRKLKKIK